MIRQLFNYFMAPYGDKDFLLQQKALNLLILTLATLILIPIVIIYSVVLSGNRTPELLIPSVFAFFFNLFSLVIFRKGHFYLFAHSIVAMLNVLLWIIVFLDRSEPLARGDSIIYIYILLTFTPLIVLTRRRMIFFYYAANIAVFLIFVFFSDFRTTVSASAFNDYVSDITVGMFFSYFISFQIFNIHKKAVSKANEEAEKNRETNIVLEKTVSMLSSIIESPPNIAIYSIDHHYNLTAFNNNFKNLSQRLYGTEAGINRNLRDLIGADVFSRAREHIEIAMEGKQLTIVQEIRRNDTVHFYEFMLNPIIDSSQSVMGLTVFMMEITERKKSEEALLKASKIESLGIFAGGIAHDFNNLLMAIMGGISLAKYDLDPGSPGFSILTDAENASLRARELTQQLLTFSRGGDPIKKVASISELIRSTSKFVLHGSNVKCIYRIAGDLRNAYVDAGQIGQVIQNVVINARQAMPGGGELMILAENSQEIPGESRERSDGYIRISVIDQGPGIPEDTIGKIFDPFFTTKTDGNGLGLAVSYSIVEKHGGRIKAGRGSTGGTSIDIYLPATGEEVDDISPNKRAPSTFKGLVLLMDDDDIVRETAMNMLLRLGLDVLVAKEGGETLEIYGRHMNSAAPVDLVILDLTVPGGMNGIETIERLRQMDPCVRALVSSGYSNDQIMANYSEYGFIDIITKPYRMKDIQEVLRKYLASS